MDLNPVMVRRKGAEAVDVRIKMGDHRRLIDRAASPIERGPRNLPRTAWRFCAFEFCVRSVLLRKLPRHDRYVYCSRESTPPFSRG
jgi:hypothetical protein